MLLTPILLASVAAQAGEAAPPAAANAPTVEQRMAQASAIGAMLHAFDRAAWVSSDALTAAIAKDRLGALGGYVVEAADPQILRVTYYRGTAAEARAFFVADVRDGKVVRQDVLATPVALTDAQMVLARAREIAARHAAERAYKPCTPLPFNTVVLPPRGARPVAVYLLSARQDADSYPVGGHYRVIVGPDGTVVTSRPYSVGCLNITRPKLPAGATPVGVTVNHLLDPAPTEIHVFTSYSMRMPVLVSTREGRMWKVEGARITPFDPK
ncbi:hypothetical protein [Sphingomonas sp. Ag1]|jgi:hypothetical protein|uniref:hypothetical protein n=1 Tax=Sphingomonas sp. Ag1 TaxID=1642949 RepID=UPI00062120FB|nr:hypothetical protein [Sphingomonas sp. Ag1]KKI20358.1 hypothetical protein XM50_05725 [Sphingomonas sp. Ag1]